MGKKPKEWFKHPDYDMDTAEYMFKGGRYIYSVFMCHLAIEKALKGLYAEKFNKIPPKTHNLIFLVEKLKLEFSDEIYDFIFTLNGVSVPTRYPDELDKMQKEYNKRDTRALLKNGKGVLRWLKERL